MIVESCASAAATGASAVTNASAALLPSRRASNCRTRCMASLLRLSQVYSLDCGARRLYVIEAVRGCWRGAYWAREIGGGDGAVSTFCNAEMRRLWRSAGRLAVPVAGSGGGSVGLVRGHSAILRTVAGYDAACHGARRQRPL